MTRIEVDAVLAAPPPAVWHILVDGERWPDWFRSPGGGLRLDHVVLRLGPPDRVGAQRECAATLGPLPLLGQWKVRWTDCLADVHCPWLLELDVTLTPAVLKRVRLRVILVEGQPGQTRLRWRVTYSPGVLWLADRLFLRRAIAIGVRGALATLAERWEAPPATPAMVPAPPPEPTRELAGPTGLPDERTARPAA